jgi:maltooligosyltrehalose trehalohydrolase
MGKQTKKTIGAVYNSKANACDFTVWAPLARQLELEVTHPFKQCYTLKKNESGYWHKQVHGIKPGARYHYIINKSVIRPDPASSYQPEGVHGPSEVIKEEYSWNDQKWNGIALENMIMYELHTGTFSTEGTFEGIIKKMNYLKDIGINAIELMPVNQFPGQKNWGYDGVYPFAVQNSYGGPYELKKLVDACHQNGIAVILDVVYNHQGPEGNYLESFAPYFTNQYHTPWGKAINFDDAYSDGVRNYYIQNALMWFRDFHIDALRLDAVHAIFDFSAKHILAELKDVVDQFTVQTNKQHYLIAESALNDPKYISPKSKAGYGMDGQWLEEFHHSLHALITGEQIGYYEDFGNIAHLAKSFTEGYVHDGIYSKYRKKKFGARADGISGHQFIVYAQNHDMIGNRLNGERLSNLTGFEKLKLAAATYFISPFVPLIFMGEEYAEDAPFMYFINHSDNALVERVKRGRKREYKALHGSQKPPDIESDDTYFQCKLDWNEMETNSRKQTMLQFYKKLIQLKKEHPVLSTTDRRSMAVSYNEQKKYIQIHRWYQNNEILAYLNFSEQPLAIELNDEWNVLLDSSAKKWGGQNDELLTTKKPDIYYIQSHSILIFQTIKNNMND